MLGRIADGILWGIQALPLSLLLTIVKNYTPLNIFANFPGLSLDHMDCQDAIDSCAEVEKLAVQVTPTKQYVSCALLMPDRKS